MTETRGVGGRGGAGSGVANVLVSQIWQMADTADSTIYDPDPLQLLLSRTNAVI